MRRAQAAMEFLMTYGWAILVVLAAIGALAYFGVLSPARFLPEQCQGPAGLDCLEPAQIDATANTITFPVKNNKGNTITITNFEWVTTSSSACTLGDKTISTDKGSTFAAINNTQIINGQDFIIKLQCGNTEIPEGRFKADFVMSYKTETGMTQRATYTITGKAS